MSMNRVNEKATTLQEVGEAGTQSHRKSHHQLGVPHLGGNSNSRGESGGVECCVRHPNSEDLHLKDKPPKCLTLGTSWAPLLRPTRM